MKIGEKIVSLTMGITICLCVQTFGQYMNVALNPNDVRTAGHGFPHASSNSEYPCEPSSPAGCAPDTTFLALNAIDGRTGNMCHGSLPNCGSWGPQMIAGLWWRVDFGHDVQLDKVVIWIRHDFPHDSWWKDATLVFSDSSTVAIHPDSVSIGQPFTFSSRVTNSLTITNLVYNENKWCAFAEVQAWGYDAPTSAVNLIKAEKISGINNTRIFCYLPGDHSFIILPDHALGADLFTIQGKKVLTFLRGTSANNKTFRMPAEFSKGIYQIKYF
ncbi:MAG TPA: hypothetical protein VLX68_16655 [Chitinivibrionales bacterium]|nr:hypothetical protein [Chitinivibrionales bacterium]